MRQCVRIWWERDIESWYDSDIERWYDSDVESYYVSNIESWYDSDIESWQWRIQRNAHDAVIDQFSGATTRRLPLVFRWNEKNAERQN